MSNKANKPELNNQSKRLHQHGFSLVEVLVTVGILAMISMGIAQMLLHTNRSVVQAERKNDFNNLVNEMQGVFNHTTNCITAFGGPGATTLNAGVSPANPQNITTFTIAGTPVVAGGNYGRTLRITRLQFTGRQAAGGAGQWVVPVLLNADLLVGGATTSATHTFNLVVSVDAANNIQGCSGSYADFWVRAVNPNDIAYMQGNVGINNNNPAFSLDVTGSIQATAFLYSSDLRLKENIREIPSALDRALKLHGVIYDWKNKESVLKATDHLGLIAQEVEKIFPEAVTTNPENGMKSVEYGNLIAPLIEALKEQQEIIRSQDQEISEIKKTLLKNNIK